jgi:hypothetical protein
MVEVGEALRDRLCQSWSLKERLRLWDILLRVVCFQGIGRMKGMIKSTYKHTNKHTYIGLAQPTITLLVTSQSGRAEKQGHTTLSVTSGRIQ